MKILPYKILFIGRSLKEEGNGMNDFELTLLAVDQVMSSQKLPIFKPYGVMAATTDFAILTGNEVAEYHFCRDDKPHLTGRSGAYWLKPSSSLAFRRLYQDTNCIDAFGDGENVRYVSFTHGIRPVLIASQEFLEQLERKTGYMGITEVTFGEYPQYVEQDSEKVNLLDRLYKENKLKLTGKAYTVDGYKFELDAIYSSMYVMEYEWNKEKYVITGLTKGYSSDVKLSNGELLQNGKPYWIKVEPITWLYDEKTNLLISKRILLSGIPLFLDSDVKDFDESFLKKFMDTFMAKEIIPSNLKTDVTLLDENEALHNYVYWKKPTKNK